MYRYYNPNPCGKAVGDCVIRAVSKLENLTWEQAFISICVFAYVHCDMPSSNAVWSAYLKSRGYRQYSLPTNCPDCYTVKDFCHDNPKGSFLVGTGTHVVAVAVVCALTITAVVEAITEAVHHMVAHMDRMVVHTGRMICPARWMR